MAKTLAQEIEGLEQGESTGPFQSWSNSDRAIVINTNTHKVIKRFRGESAWSNADRYSYDCYIAARNNTN